MTTFFEKSDGRDYRLTGIQGEQALEKGLVGAEWYATPIPREKLKQLMQRKDFPAIRDTIIWFAALIGTGYIATLSYGTWWAIPAFLLYGLFWGVPGDSRWHESGHGTAFKTQWMNEVLYYISSFMNLRPATAWRWSHARHHTDTIIVGRDPEILSPRPPVWKILIMEVIRLYAYPAEFKRTIKHALGKLNEEEKKYIPMNEWWKCYLEARVTLSILLVIAIYSIYTQSFLPILLVGLSTCYGSILAIFLGMAQHLGLNEDVLDHRLNTRTIYLNPFVRFLYWNMNYHMEHHMYPMVPYHALPKLHEAIKHDCPKPNPGLFHAMREIIRTLRMQSKDPSSTILRPLPVTANPYKYGPHPFGQVLSLEEQFVK